MMWPNRVFRRDLKDPKEFGTKGRDWHYTVEEDGDYVKICFYDFGGQPLYLYNHKPPQDEMELDLVWRIEGPSKGLREGRHSYFGEDGYVFYLNKDFLLASIEIANKYFDLD